MRVHADAEADALSRAVDAEAFTTGRDVYFRAGAYAPDSPDGLRLLAHEAAHTVQQAAGPVAGTPAPGGVALSDPADRFERAATQAGRARRLGEEAPAAEAPATAPAETDAAPVQRQEVGDQFYAHGAFMGAARRLLPRSAVEPHPADVDAGRARRRAGRHRRRRAHADVREQPGHGGVRDAEATQELDQRQEAGRSDRIETMEAIEWDVLLDPDVMRAYSVAHDEETEAALDRLLVDTIVIAHGNTKQTVVENVIGYPQYDAVRETPKSALGGATSAAWMDLFGRALRLATAGSPEETDRLMEEMRGEARHTDEDDQSLYQTFKDRMPFDAVVELYKRVFEKDHFSVLLDIKSGGRRGRDRGAWCWS